MKLPAASCGVSESAKGAVFPPSPLGERMETYEASFGKMNYPAASNGASTSL